MNFTSSVKSLLCLLALAATARAEIKLPSIIGSHMVLQQGQKNPLWGWAKPGADVTVSVQKQTLKTQADDQGKWKVEAAPLPVGGPYEITIESGGQTTVLEDVLSGEVWICSGQSNMAWSVGSANDPDLETLTAK